MSASWAKMSSNLDSNPKIRRAGRNGREVFLFVLRKNSDLDLGGRVPELYVEGWYLADQLMMPEPEAVSGLSQCVRTGLLKSEEAHVVIVGWDDEWGKRPLTEAERKRQQRAKSKTSDGESGHVTEVSGQKQDSPECHGSEEKRGEKKRVEEKREDAPAKPSRPTKSSLPEGWTPQRSEPNDRAWREAQARGVDCRAELEAIRDHALANAWRKVDWNATWRNWLRRANAGRRAANGNGQTALDAQLERVRMLEAEEARGTSS